jgi:AcrR family transcriptional regulator
MARAKASEKVRTRLDTDERRAQLLALGAQAFIDAAYDEVSIDDIAQKARVSKGLVYHYFPTKRHLYVEAIRHVGRDLTEKVLAAPLGATPEARMVHGLDSFLEHASAHAAAFSAVMRGGVGSDAEVTAVVDEIRQVFLDRMVEGALGAGMLGGERLPEIARLGLKGWIGMVEATTLTWLARREAPKEQVRNLLMDVLQEIIRFSLR